LVTITIDWKILVEGAMPDLPKVSLFFGGPGDTDREAGIVAASVRTLAAFYKKAGLLELDIWHWCGEDNPTTFTVREDVQDRIDEKLRPDVADLVIVVFRDKLGTNTTRNGRGYESSSAYELETALAGTGEKQSDVALFQFQPRFRDDFEALEGAPPDVVTRRVNDANERRLERERIGAYLRATRQRLGRLNRMRYSNFGTFSAQVNDFLSERLELIRKRLEPPPPPPPPSQRRSRRPELPGYPFRSLQSLDYRDYDIFRGRAARLAELNARLADPRIRFLCLAGPSGAGKSSMLKAGLVGGLVRSRKDGGAPFWVIDMHPDRDPFEKFENGASRMYWCSDGAITEASPLQPVGLRRLLFDACCGDSAATDTVLREHFAAPLWAAAGDSHSEILLVIDQLEELWTKSDDNGKRRDAFLQLIAAAVRCPKVHVLATLRSDVFPHFEAARLVAEALLAGGRGVIEHLTPPAVPNELEAMIRETAEAGGIELQSGLVDALLTDAEGVGSSALPLVAFTLSQLVTRAQGGPVTRESYRAIGRLPGAIENTVQSSVRRHLPDSKDLTGKLAHLFSHLVDMRDMTVEPMPVRSTRHKTDLLRHGVDAGVIDALIDARVLHVGDPGGDSVVLAHDALFEKWKPLADWVNGNRIDLAFRAMLLRDAREWKRHAGRVRNIRLAVEALKEAQAQVAERRDLFGHVSLIHEYLMAATRQQDKVTFIQAINTSSPAEALDALLRHGGDLGLDPFEDRGTNANQLRPGIYAAVTGDDRSDRDLWGPPSKEDSGAKQDQSAAPEGRLGAGAEVTKGLPEPEAESLYEDPENRDVRVTRGRGPTNYAAMFGRTTLLRKLIALGEKPREKTWGGHTLLVDAAYGGHLETVRFLIEEQNCGVEEENADGSRPILWACQRGHELVVDYLISKGAQFIFPVPGGWSCLTEAAYGGHLPLVRRLVEQENCDPHQTTEDRQTLLHRAASGHQLRNLDVVRYLCKDHGVDKTRVDRNGWSALFSAVLEGTPEMVLLLLELGLDPNLRDTSGQTPLHIACGRRGSLGILKALIESPNIDLNACDKGGQTPIAYAAIRGHDRLVYALLVRGADPTKVEGKGWAALHHAAADNDLAVIEVLCSTADRAVLNSRVAPGWTPLMVAARDNRTEAVELLRKAGAALHLRTIGQATALHLASLSGALGAVKALIARGGTPADVPALLHAPDHIGLTALGVGARKGHADIVRVLLEAGANPDGRVQGDFLLPELAERGEIEASVRQLALCQAPNVRDAKGRTALFVAAAAGNAALCRVLLSDNRVYVDARQWLHPQFAVDDEISGFTPAPKLLPFAPG
jgi:ankyrin repeat protein